VHFRDGPTPRRPRAAGRQRWHVVRAGVRADLPWDPRSCLWSLLGGDDAPVSHLYARRPRHCAPPRHSRLAQRDRWHITAMSPTSDIVAVPMKARVAAGSRLLPQAVQGGEHGFDFGGGWSGRIRRPDNYLLAQVARERPLDTQPAGGVDRGTRSRRDIRPHSCGVWPCLGVRPWLSPRAVAESVQLHGTGASDLSRLPDGPTSDLARFAP
jgi:hypothetical protein